MTTFIIRSPYFLETANGNIELSKGMYLCMVRRKGLLPKVTKLTRKFEKQKNTKTTRRTNLRSYVKPIRKINTTKHYSKKRNHNLVNLQGTVTLQKGQQSYTFEIFDQAGLFPSQISKFYIPIGFDNDYSSDEQQIQKSIKNAFMSLCLSTYDHRLVNHQ